MRVKHFACLKLPQPKKENYCTHPGNPTPWEKLGASMYLTYHKNVVLICIAPSACLITSRKSIIFDSVVCQTIQASRTQNILVTSHIFVQKMYIHKALEKGGVLYSLSHLGVLIEYACFDHFTKTKRAMTFLESYLSHQTQV